MPARPTWCGARPQVRSCAWRASPPVRAATRSSARRPATRPDGSSGPSAISTATARRRSWSGAPDSNAGRRPVGCRLRGVRQEHDEQGAAGNGLPAETGRIPHRRHGRGPGGIRADGVGATSMATARADILIGAPGSDSAYVVFGKSGTAKVDLADVASGVGGFRIIAESGGDLARMSVAGGRRSQSRWRQRPGDRHTRQRRRRLRRRCGLCRLGRRHGHRGPFSGGTGNRWEPRWSAPAGSLTGATVAIASDVDGDGTSDLMIGAPGRGESAYVLFFRFELAARHQHLRHQRRRCDRCRLRRPARRRSRRRQYPRAGTATTRSAAVVADDTIEGNGGDDTLSGDAGQGLARWRYRHRPHDRRRRQ
jgi:hypothetical protein